MTAQSRRAIVLAGGAAAFAAAFLVISGMPLFQVTLTIGGGALIALVMVGGIALLERIDAKHAAKTQRRNREIEADDRQRKLWEKRLG